MSGVPEKFASGALSLLQQDEEAALRAARPWAAARVADRSVISIGVGVRRFPDLASSLERSGEIVLPRRSGGTAIPIASGDLLWSLVLPSADPRVGRDFASAYGRLGSGVTAFLHERSVRASWVAAPGIASQLCPLGDRGCSLAVEDRILGGAAQRKAGAALLHHGVIWGTADRGRWSRLFGIPRPVLESRATALREFGLVESANELADALERALHRWLADAPGPG